MMMSGPAPEFEVTAVCWLMSSQPTKSTLTSTPVSLVNLAALARNTSSSACTKRTGRSMRKDAPFSIANLGAGDVGGLDGGLRRSAGRGQRGGGNAQCQRVAAGNIVRHLVFSLFLFPALIAGELAGLRFQPEPRVFASILIRLPGRGPFSASPE